MSPGSSPAPTNNTRRSSPTLASTFPIISTNAVRSANASTSGHHSRKPSSGPEQSPDCQRAPAAHIDVVVDRVEGGQAVGEVETHIEEREVGLLQDDLQAQQFADAGGGGWMGGGHGDYSTAAR